MGVEATLIEQDGRRVTGLDDPTGGSFDSAGGFDRFLGRDDRDLRVLNRVDVEGVSSFARDDMEELLADIGHLVGSGSLTPSEEKGLLRLRGLAEECLAGARLQLMFVGD